MRRFVLAMGFVTVAILEVELHQLRGLLAWHEAQM
jgi:hypothetical protein